MEEDLNSVQLLTERVSSVARSLGLDVREPQVLRSGANLVIHLAPAPVVARVATLTAEMRGGGSAYLRRERDLCIALAERGLDIVTPTDLVDPGPHQVGDGDNGEGGVEKRAFLLLGHRQLTPIDIDSADHATAAGRALVDVVAALAELPPELGRGDEGQPWSEVATLMKTVQSTTDASAFERIGAVIDVLRSSEPDDPWQLVHGDAHPGNVAIGEDGVVWFDFEDANRRPLAWDLASLRRSWPAAGDAACRLLGVDPNSPSMRWHHEFRDVYALLWNLLYAKRDDRMRPAAAKRLHGWLIRTEGF